MPSPRRESGGWSVSGQCCAPIYGSTAHSRPFLRDATLDVCRGLARGGNDKRITNHSSLADFRDVKPMLLEGASEGVNLVRCDEELAAAGEALIAELLKHHFGRS